MKKYFDQYPSLIPLPPMTLCEVRKMGVGVVLCQIWTKSKSIRVLLAGWRSIFTHFLKVPPIFAQVFYKSTPPTPPGLLLIFVEKNHPFQLINTRF